MSQAADAIAFFQGGWNCTQAILAAHCTLHGVDRDEAMRAAATVSAGPRPEEMCGAVTGALLVIGLARGRGSMRHAATAPDVQELTQRFKERFQQRNGGLFCRELLAQTEELSQARATPDEAAHPRCLALLQSASEILDELLDS